MNYRVEATGENKAYPQGKLYHVTITVSGSDDQQAAEKAIVYLNRIYDTRRWRVDAVSQLVSPYKGARRPISNFKRRSRRIRSQP